jgi:hypothetical protein
VNIFADKRLTIKEIWSASLHLYCKTFPHVWPQAAVISIVAFLIALLTNNEACVQIDVNNITSANILCAFMYVLASLIIIYFGILLLYRIYVIGDGQNVTLGASVVYVGKKYFKVVISMLIILFACMLGIFAFVIPGLFLLILFFMVQPLILLDDQRCIAALKGSCKLVWGNWWRTFSIFFPLMLLNYLAVMATQFALTHAYWYMIVGVGFARIFVYPLFYACVITQFGNLKLRYQEKCQAESL